MMDLSIIIVSWQVKDSLSRCLNSIREASPRLEYEVIVVDNASRDGSAALVRRDCAWVHLLENSRNLGFAAASNRALQESRGRYLLLLNPDTVVRPGSLEEMVSFLDTHPAAGAAGGRLLNPDGSGQPSVRAFPSFQSGLEQFTILGDLGFFRRVRHRYLMKSFNYSRPAPVDQPMGAALFLRKEAGEKVGWLDEDFFLYFEEVDLCCRLRQAGFEIWYNPACRIVHYGGLSSEQAGGKALFWLLKSQLLYLRKHSSPAAFFRFRLIFKPLLAAGLLWDLIGDSLRLGVRVLTFTPPEKLKTGKKRLRKRWEFISHYLPKLLIEG